MTAARHDLPVTQRWMRDGESFFADQLAALRDADLGGPSALPGWDRRAVIAHIARNAEALTRLVRWARTGIETRMYADPGQRVRDIEASARQPPEALQADVQRTAARLDDAIAKLPGTQWQATVRSGLGREIPAAEVPWLRCREVWLHGLDLRAGGVPGDIPTAFAEVLVDEVTGYMSAQPSVPETEIISTRDGRRWHISGSGAADAQEPARPSGASGQALEVRGDPRVLAAWLTGRNYDRSALQADELPQLPTWL